MPDSNMVKVIYGLGSIGTAYMGQVPPVASKQLTLFAKGGWVLGLVQALVLGANIRDKKA